MNDADAAPDIDTAAERSSPRAADRALVGCLSIAGVFIVAAFFYFGFFAFALADGWYEWGLLEPYIDERTAEFLSVVYWPLIQLMLYFELF